jgi:hypothetical protein
MLSPLRANRLVACLPSLSLNCTRNFATTSNEGRKPGRPRIHPIVASNEASEPLPAAAQLQLDVSTREHSLAIATSLKHYSSLPPLPPVDDWLPHFAYTPLQVRDRISIRTPASAISVARSFINSEKTSTNNPKVIIEAFPGVRRLKSVVTIL